MYLITAKNCQNCKRLESMLSPYVLIQVKEAEENMELCKKLGIKTVPALVKDDKSVEFDLEKIANIINRKEN